MKSCVLCGKEAADDLAACECGYRFGGAVGGTRPPAIAPAASFQPGEGIRTVAMFVALASLVLAVWGILGPDTQAMLMLFLGGGFCGVIAAILYGVGAIVSALTRSAAAAEDRLAPTDKAA